MSACCLKELWIRAAYWLFLGVVERVCGRIDDLALNLVCPATVISERTSASSNITLGHGDGLSIIQRLNSGQKVKVLLEQFGELYEVFATLFRSGLVSPIALERLSCGGDGDVDILL